MLVAHQVKTVKMKFLCHQHHLLHQVQKVSRYTTDLTELWWQVKILSCYHTKRCLLRCLLMPLCQNVKVRSKVRSKAVNAVLARQRQKKASTRHTICMWWGDKFLMYCHCQFGEIHIGWSLYINFTFIWETQNSGVSQISQGWQPCQLENMADLSPVSHSGTHGAWWRST